MPRPDDDDDIYDAFLDMREANEEYEYDEYDHHDEDEYDEYDDHDEDEYDEYDHHHDGGECHEMSGEPYDVFIDILDDEDGDEYVDYHHARIRWSAWTSAADAHERRLLLEKEKRNMARDIENEGNYILRAREATQGVCQMVPCDSDELYWLRYQYCMLTDELEKYRASSYRMTTGDASSDEVLSAEPDIESGYSVAVECAEWVLANE